MSSSSVPLHMKIVSIHRQIPHQHQQEWQSVQSWQQVQLEGIQHFFFSMPLIANGTFEPLAHVLPPLWDPAQEPTAVKTGCSADTPHHFAAPVGKPAAFQFWFQLSEEKGLSSASRSAPQISPPLRRESSQCPAQSLSSNRDEALVPSTRVSFSRIF